MTIKISARRSARRAMPCHNTGDVV